MADIAVNKRAGAVRPKHGMHRHENRSPKKIPTKRLNQSLTAKVKGQTEKPQLIAADAGILERRRLFTQADTGFQAINRSWTVTWFRHRLREYVNIHGYASAGVC